jgi:hypothetical protein
MWRCQRTAGHLRLPDECRGGQPPLPSQAYGHLIGGDDLHQPVHRHRSAYSRGDQRIPAQRPDRVTGRQRVLQQRRQHHRHLVPEPPSQALGGVAAAGAAGSPRARKTPAAAAARPRPARLAASPQTPVSRWWPPSRGIRSASGRPAASTAAPGPRSAGQRSRPRHLVPDRAGGQVDSLKNSRAAIHS